METRHDLRRHNRRACDQNITVLWRDLHGQDKFVNAKALDISELGLRLQMPEELPRQAYLASQVRQAGPGGTRLSAALRAAGGRQVFDRC